MNTFKRLGDIISSNINSALEKAENPEKMIDLSIKKLEDARIELKTTIAEKSAEKSVYEKKLEEEKASSERWAERARLAISRGMDDMAREAVEAKLEMDKGSKEDERTIASLESVISSLSGTLTKVESKLEEMKAKSAELKARAKSAKERIRANKAMEKASGIEWQAKLEELNSRIEKWEVEASIAEKETRAKPTFEEMERDEAIETELKRIKEEMNGHA